MITQEHSIKIKQIIGHGYGRKIHQYFVANKVVNDKGDVYSESMIRRALNSLSVKEVVIQGIYDCVKEVKEKKKQLAAARAKILEDA